MARSTFWAGRVSRVNFNVDGHEMAMNLIVIVSSQKGFFLARRAETAYAFGVEADRRLTSRIRRTKTCVNSLLQLLLSPCPRRFWALPRPQMPASSSLAELSKYQLAPTAKCGSKVVAPLRAPRSISPPNAPRTCMSAATDHAKRTSTSCAPRAARRPAKRNAKSNRPNSIVRRLAARIVARLVTRVVPANRIAPAVVHHVNRRATANATLVAKQRHPVRIAKRSATPAAMARATPTPT
jgi:hypothetical protein